MQVLGIIMMGTVLMLVIALVSHYVETKNK